MTIIKIIIRVFVVFCAMASTAYAQTGSTTFFVGTPGDSPRSLQGYGVSTAQIDPIIAQYTNLGSAYTTNLANGVFNDLSSLKQQLNTDLVTALNSSPDVSVNSLQVTVNPIHARIWQTGTGFGLLVDGIDFNANVDIDVHGFAGFFCPTATVSAELSDIELQGFYDVYGGNLSNVQLDYTLGATNYNCSGLLGDVAEFFAPLFFNLRDEIRGEIRDGLTNLNGLASMQSLFSIEDFLEGLREYGDVIEDTYLSFPTTASISISALGDLSDFGIPANVNIDIPVIQQDISDEFNKVIDAAQMIISNQSGTSLQLDIIIHDGPSNQVSLIASHRPVDVMDLVNTQIHTLFIALDAPPHTGSVDVFRKGTYGPWSFDRTVTPPYPWRINVGLDAYMEQFVAIGESSLIPGLKSFPGRVQILDDEYTCFNDPGNCRSHRGNR